MNEHTAARNHAKLFASQKDGAGGHALFYLIMAPRLTESIYGRAMKDATETTSTVALTEYVMDRVSICSRISDAYEPRQVVYKTFHISKVLRQTGDIEDRQSRDSAGEDYPEALGIHAILQGPGIR